MNVQNEEWPFKKMKKKAVINKTVSTSKKNILHKIKYVKGDK